ncbi:MAG: acyl-CoA dehydrogenase family protein, partial [Sphingomonadaceae bacterium]|nr:acyl-CoA dehydrogenase family protein [Sphingomonadaceae bacterium]
MLQTNMRKIYGPEHELFRDQVRRFFDQQLVPNLARWEVEGIVDRAFWLACGEAGLLCPTVPEAYGGLGLDFRYNAIIDEEIAYAGSAAGIGLQSDIIADYICNYGSDEQRAKWLPKMISGEVITAIAMTVPGTGSDLQAIRTTARRDGDDYIVNGSKTYITNGQNADLVIVVARTGDTGRGKDISLILVEAVRAGFARGRNLDKIGQHSADTSELF